MKPELAGGRSAAQPFAWGPSKLSLRKGPHSHSRAWNKLPALERGPQLPDRKGDKSGDTIPRGLARTLADLAQVPPAAMGKGKLPL